MTNPIDRRLDRLETEVQKRTDPGHGPIFTLIDHPHDPENAKRWGEAWRFRLENPKGLIIHNFIVAPPNGDADWRRFIEAGTNVQVSKALDEARRSLMSEMTDAAGDGVQDKTDQFRRIYLRHAERYQALCAELSGQELQAVRAAGPFKPH
jgi:hypothetical protein